MGHGKFITLEGTEGVGKTTNLELIREEVARAGHSVLTTREPGGTPLAEEIRELLLAVREETVAD
ncbi:MAG: dTMP kinase, partial [Gammaproteobacteria bacterium]|nr:dTMP kinase [Gammaproteobacteria bacterium]